MEITVNTLDLLIIDADYLFHRGYYAFSDTPTRAGLRTTAGVESGAFYGFFSLLLRKIRDYSPQQTIICWGDKRENLKRREIYTEYKSDRHAASDSFIEQMRDVKASLFLMNFKQYLSPGYEGDDVIASIVRLNNDNEREIKILTNDKDLFQLVDKKVKISSLASSIHKRDQEFGIAETIEKFGVSPALLIDYLVLTGDSADGIPGVPGIGEKTAVKLLNTFGPIYDWFDVIEKLDITSAIKTSLLASRKAMIRNKLLISLYQNKAPLHELLDWDKYETAEEVFAKYEMQKITPKDFL